MAIEHLLYVRHSAKPFTRTFSLSPHKKSVKYDYAPVCLKTFRIRRIKKFAPGDLARSTLNPA